MKKTKNSYKKSGVNIKAADKFAKYIGKYSKEVFKKKINKFMEIFSNKLNVIANNTNSYLKSFLLKLKNNSYLLNPMKYGIFSGGKRFRSAIIVNTGKIFNIEYKKLNWIGTKACRKNNLLSPQWLRNVKDRIYPIWRLDILFSDKKYNSMEIIENGGWHFSNIKSPDAIQHKLRSYLHHHEYDLSPIGIEGIKKMIENKEAIYNLKHDQRSLNKIGSGEKLTKVNLSNLPEYITLNRKKFDEINNFSSSWDVFNSHL